MEIKESRIQDPSPRFNDGGVSTESMFILIGHMLPAALVLLFVCHFATLPIRVCVMCFIFEVDKH